MAYASYSTILGEGIIVVKFTLCYRKCQNKQNAVLNVTNLATKKDDRVHGEIILTCEFF